MSRNGPLEFEQQVCTILADREKARVEEAIATMESVVKRLNGRRPRGQLKQTDRRRRRMCAHCRRFLPADRRSAYCTVCQSQRMVARRNTLRVIEYEEKQRAWYESLDPAIRSRLEGWLFWSTRDDPEQRAMVLEHRRKFNVTDNPYEHLFAR